MLNRVSPQVYALQFFKYSIYCVNMIYYYYFQEEPAGVVASHNHSGYVLQYPGVGSYMRGTTSGHQGGSSSHHHHHNIPAAHQNNQRGGHVRGGGGESTPWSSHAMPPTLSIPQIPPMLRTAGSVRTSVVSEPVMLPPPPAHIHSQPQTPQRAAMYEDPMGRYRRCPQASMNRSGGPPGMRHGVPPPPPPPAGGFVHGLPPPYHPWSRNPPPHYLSMTARDEFGMLVPGHHMDYSRMDPMTFIRMVSSVYTGREIYCYCFK